jgi:hypothetical protein
MRSFRVDTGRLEMQVLESGPEDGVPVVVDDGEAVATVDGGVVGPADVTAAPPRPVVPTKLTNPKSRMSVATNATTPSAMPRAGEPDGDGSIIGDSVSGVGSMGGRSHPTDQVAATSMRARSKRGSAAFASSRSNEPVA